jgi:hypothetical protein
MGVRCPACALPVAAENVDLASGWAKCVECQEVFTFRSAAAPKPPVPAQVPMPAKFEVREEEGRLVVSWKWFSPVHLFMIVFAVFWWGFLFVWYGALVVAAVSVQGGWVAAIFMGVAGLPFVAAGIGIVYFALAGYRNRTFVTVSRDRLEIRHRPMRWFGEKTLATRDLAQIYCERNEHRGKHGTHASYSIHALSPERRKLEILKGLESPEQARFLEDRIERFLGIADLPVQGELPKG